MNSLIRTALTVFAGIGSFVLGYTACQLKQNRDLLENARYEQTEKIITNAAVSYISAHTSSELFADGGTRMSQEIETQARNDLAKKHLPNPGFQVFIY